MGRWIDRAAVTALTAAAFYILFISAFGNIPVACCLSFLCCALLFRLRRGGKYRLSGAQAQSILHSWAFGDDDDAKSQIESLTGLSENLLYLPRHPDSTLSTGDVFSAWKKHRGEKKIILSAVCHSDARARTFAGTLQSPTVEILDASRLIPLIRRSGLTPPQPLHGRQLAARLKNLLIELPYRRPWHRNLLFGLGLMLAYLFTGSGAYLALSIGALFLSGTAIRRRS